MKKVIVLGGGGFIGGHLAKKLKAQGFFVRIADIKNMNTWLKMKYAMNLFNAI